jgi:hypothetical protein
MGRFMSMPSTHWTLIECAAGDDTAAAAALSDLLSSYYQALFAYLINVRKLERSVAEDMLQGFLMQQFLEKNLATVARNEPGYRFRNLVLTALNRHVAGEYRKLYARKRRPEFGESIESLASELVRSETTNHTFDVEWARALMKEILARMRAECRQSNRNDVWTLFECCQLNPCLSAGPQPTLGEIVEQYALKSEQQARNLLVTARRMFNRHLREVLGRYVATEEEMDSEIAELLAALRAAIRSHELNMDLAPD